MRQLATENEQQQQMKEREVAELRRQLQTSQTAPAQKRVVRIVSKPEVIQFIHSIHPMGELTPRMTNN
jgi:hypothetical protein